MTEQEKKASSVMRLIAEDSPQPAGKEFDGKTAQAQVPTQAAAPEAQETQPQPTTHTILYIESSRL